MGVAESELRSGIALKYSVKREALGLRLAQGSPRRPECNAKNTSKVDPREDVTSLTPASYNLHGARAIYFILLPVHSQNIIRLRTMSLGHYRIA
jgi:hypothetical protein